MENRDELVDALQGVLRVADAEVWVTALSDAGVPAGRVGDIGWP